VYGQLRNQAHAVFRNQQNTLQATAVLHEALRPTPFSIATRGINVDESGKVGIGTSSPAGPLDIIAAQLRAFLREPFPALVTGTNNGGALYFGPGSGAIATEPTGAIETSWGDALYPQMSIGVVRDGPKANILMGYNGETQIRNGLTTNLFVSPSGNVGIGVANPGVPIDCTLDVGGNIRSRGSDLFLNGRGGGAGNNSGNGRALVDDGTGVWGNGIYTGGLVLNFGNDFGKVVADGPMTVEGDLTVDGFLSKLGGSFKIDHPLDPENKYLYHSFVESPDMMNIYNGIIMTDAAGYATIELPAYFEALNRDFRYQLTVVDSADSKEFVLAKVVQEVRDNRFKIRTSRGGAKVSWQVTGIRHDPVAEMRRVTPEVEKEPSVRGRFLAPEAYGQPAARGVHNRESSGNTIPGAKTSVAP
jgi:hypothetical protein